MSVRGVDDHTCGLVYNGQMFIMVEECEGDVLCDKVWRLRRCVCPDNFVALSQTIPRLGGGLSIYKDFAITKAAFNLRASKGGIVLFREEDVKTHGDVVGVINQKSERGATRGALMHYQMELSIWA